MIGDFSFRTQGRADILFSHFLKLPFSANAEIAHELIIRTLRLNCLTDAYADLWEEHTGLVWTPDVPLRSDLERRQALVENDALVAIALGVSADELSTVYRTQFPVLRSYDNGTSRSNDYVYDANGRVVPAAVRQRWAKKGDAISIEERTAVHPGSGVTYVYEFPFARRDREADLRAAYASFESLLENLE